MLWNLRKKNVELNDEYNKLIGEKSRLEVSWVEMKRRVQELEEEEEFKDRESFEVSVESVRVTSNLIVSLITSKKLFDSSIFIDDKNSNIEDWLSTMRNTLKENAN
jgi:predicted nuclease with TOPRIM domain